MGGYPFFKNRFDGHGGCGWGGYGSCGGFDGFGFGHHGGRFDCDHRLRGRHGGRRRFWNRGWDC
ncbi:hypothetical protein [Methanosarcina sp.]|uniref:hypothetical protein n=1 Tax=Methanosarcina sp. TaxID=2213 RepID=UPI0029898654|nr:hypothetical protein [Methanosarcina sp.]MDW5551718.1 hypothetical protein [Methanosarcina sp.]MDW5553220.1 hypothetical protein [Methanosarcina sp.]MDW5558316.1 hypothetical protein [Methanosarcina sp.]